MISLVAIAAVVPAIAASLNGLSFQSECKRIAERSKMIAQVLVERRDDWNDFLEQHATSAADKNDPGAWILRAIELTEAAAQVVTDEVAEWSVLYSRDLSEPG